MTSPERALTARRTPGPLVWYMMGGSEGTTTGVHSSLPSSTSVSTSMVYSSERFETFSGVMASALVNRCWCFLFFKQKTAYEISECDWSSDVCSSDLKQKSTRLNSSHIQNSRMPSSACDRTSTR